MTRRTPHPLDAEERALAAALPRLHERGEPGPSLDAAILAAAHAAVRPGARDTPPRQRRSWIAPSALAASLLLALGLAWQLRPPGLPVAASTESDATAAAANDVEQYQASAAPAAEEARAVVAKPAPVAVTAADPQSAAVDHAAIARQTAPAETPAAAVASAPMPDAPPPPPPAAAMQPDVPAVEAMATAQSAEPARASAPTMAKQAGTARERESSAANAAAAAAEHDAVNLDSMPVADAAEDVPPATADSPEVRDAWLRRIGELLQQGKADEARASLDEFRRRYPDAPLPPELRKLEP